jgi:hypothetical protein
MAPHNRQHIRKMVGMAGFEPAASCSQISSSRSPDVASRRPMWRLPGEMLAGCRLTSPGGCARWLPLWLPPTLPRTSASLHRTEKRLARVPVDNAPSGAWPLHPAAATGCNYRRNGVQQLHPNRPLHHPGNRPPPARALAAPRTTGRAWAAAPVISSTDCGRAAR